MSTDAAGRRYIPAPLHVDIEQRYVDVVIEALVGAGDAWRNGTINRGEGYNRIDIEAGVGDADSAAACYRAALVLEDARTDAETRRGNGRPRRTS